MRSIPFLEEYRRELRRIGLEEDSSPYGGMASGGEDAVRGFLAHLRALPEGATWRDVHPDIPAHWDLDDDETWTHAYRPRGAYDYQTLPCGPAMLVRFPLGSTDADLQRLCADAASHGWSVYGSGYVPIDNPDFPARLVDIILDVATTEERWGAFVRWVEQRADIDVASISRPVGMRFAPEEGT